MSETAGKGEKMIIRMTTFILVAAALLLLECSNSPVASGSGSTTETAMIYNPGGSPAVGAKVRFYPVNHVPKAGLPKAAASIDSATTDKNGNFTVTLDTGTYNMLVSGDSGLSYQDSITIKRDTTRVPEDTLGAPGSIKGVVRLQPGDDARTVFILFMGTNTWGTPDDSTGKFTVASMAEGTYRVRILTTLDLYTPKDTVLSFTTGKVDTLPNDIVLQYTGIPVPSGMRISYDTLKQIVKLIWNKPVTGRPVKGFNVYRMNVDSNTTLAAINSHLVTDTTYSDSTGVQDLTFEYRVATVDTNGTEGVKSAGISILIASAFQLATEIGNGVGTGVGKFGNLQDIVVGSTGNIYAADANAIHNKIWVFDTTGTIRDSIGTDSGAAFVDRIRRLGLKGDSLLVTAQGNKALVFDARDSLAGRIGATGTGDSLFTSDLLLGIMFAGSQYYVIDDHTIKVFADSFTFVNKFGGVGNGVGQIGPSETPVNIASDSAGNVLLAVSSAQSRLLRYHGDGIYISEIAIQHQILDFKIQGARLYFVVSDAAGWKGVLIFNGDGTLYGRLATQFYPNCVAALTNGTLLIGSEDGKIREFHRK